MTEQLALIADIGGTHARFALVRPGAPPADTVVLRCGDYRGPAEAAQGYLATVAPGQAVRRAAFAVASPVTGERIDMTNSPWSFTVAEVGKALGLERLEVVNDFTAVALSLRHLAGDDLVRLGGGEGVAGAALAVLGPGTGLGVSGLVPAAGRWSPLSTEGGHVTLAAADEREAAVIAWLRHRFGHVSAERVLSGPGLVSLYEAVAAVLGRQPVYNTPDAITQRAVDNTCPVCRETLDTFFAFLGTVAGDLALTLGARGGVFLAGGILPRVRGALEASNFRSRFEAKGRFQAYLAPVPTWLVVHPQPAFAGLAGLVSED